MGKINFADATTKIQNIISQAPRDGSWVEIDGCTISIDDNNSDEQMTAAIYNPGSACEGECDLYVRL